MIQLTTRRVVQYTLGLLGFAAATAAAQEAQPGTAATAPTVGQMAPDFTLPGTTRYGALREPVTLSKLRGQTVVIAFFPKARTRG